MSKKTYHHGNLRNSLVDAAIPLLRREGAAGLSLRAVAKAAGVSHSAPYRHFRNKTALLEAIAQRGYRQLRDANLRAVAEHPDDPVRQLQAAGGSYLLMVIRQPEVAELMLGGGVLRPDSWGQALQESARDSFGALMRIMENGRNAGIFADKPVEDLALAALSTVHGLSMALLAGHFSGTVRSEADIERLGIRVYETLLAGLLKR